MFLAEKHSNYLVSRLITFSSSSALANINAQDVIMIDEEGTQTSIHFSLSSIGLVE